MDSAENKSKYGKYVNNALIFGDFVVINIAYLLTCGILHLWTGHVLGHSLREVMLAVNVAYIPVVFITLNTHRQRPIYMESIYRRALTAVICHALCLGLLCVLLSLNYIHWRFLLVFYLLFAIMLPAWWITSRIILKYYRAHGRNFLRVVIVGTGPTAMYLYNEMMSDAGFGYKFKGFFTNDPSPETPEGLYLGRLDDLEQYVAEHHIDEIYYTLSGEREAAMQTAIRAAENNVAQFYYVPQINRLATSGFTLLTLGSMPVLSLMSQPLESFWNRMIKRSFDVAFSSAFLAVSPVLFVPIAIAIKLSSPGPVFFRQKRTGYRGNEFNCLKFRTMKVNADADTKQAERDDPRKTPLGNFLRRTNLDELPQFINVWLGDMSVVGPRPHMLKHTEDYRRLIDRYMLRHYVKPGITGWAQVSGFRGETRELWQMEKRVEHDVWYIRNWSFFLDLKIVVLTVTNMFRGEKNAY